VKAIKHYIFDHHQVKSSQVKTILFSETVTQLHTSIK